MPPTLQTINPNNAPVGSRFTISLTGQYVGTGNSRPYLDNVEVPLSGGSGSTIKFVLPDWAEVGPHQVKINNVSGNNQGESNSLTLNVTTIYAQAQAVTLTFGSQAEGLPGKFGQAQGSLVFGTSAQAMLTTLAEGGARLVFEAHAKGYPLLDDGYSFLCTCYDGKNATILMTPIQEHIESVEADMMEHMQSHQLYGANRSAISFLCYCTDGEVVQTALGQLRTVEDAINAGDLPGTEQQPPQRITYVESTPSV